MQKKAIRTVTHSNYIAHSEPLLKDLNLINVKDLMDIKLIKFLHKLYHNNLPIYFNDYTPHLEKRETRYNLRSLNDLHCVTIVSLLNELQCVTIVSLLKKNT